MNIQKLVVKNKNKYLKDLAEYVAIPSVSTERKYEKGMQKAASWVSTRMKKAGLENVHMIKTKGHPILYADWLHKKGKPTVLFYGHYDVQPAEPLDQWKSDPFTLTIKNGAMYARGVSDNKAPHLSHILGVETLLKETGELPVNVKFCLEGEEEIGSLHFSETLKKHTKTFQSDVAFVADGIMEYDAPVIEYGLRGLVYLEIKVTCLGQDVHSGTYGGTVDNPIQVLSYIISRLKDRNGKILIPGIYEKVRNVSKEELRLLKKAEVSTESIKKETGAKLLFGEKGFLNIVKKGARPTLEINGIWGGFTAKGAKTIIPAEAHAKISMRLVPNLTAKDVEQKFRTFVKKITPKTAEVEVKLHSGNDPILFDIKNPIFIDGEKVLIDVFGIKPKYTLVGGTIGAIDSIYKILGIESFSTGFSLPDCGMHSPNEKFMVENFFKGMEVTAQYLQQLGETV